MFGWSWEDTQALPVTVRLRALAKIRDWGDVTAEEPGIEIGGDTGI